MRIAFIIHRYGTEILGGPEYACRLLAETTRRSARRRRPDDVRARQSITWKNDYAEGADRVRGVTVRRFASSQIRDIDDFTRYSDWIFQNPHDAADEMEWLKRQGPWSPGLIDYLKRHHKQYEALIFVNYRHAPTVLGLQIDPARSILIPAAHDEPAIHLDIFRGCVPAADRRSAISASRSGDLSRRRSTAMPLSRKPSAAASKFHHTTPTPKPDRPTRFRPREPVTERDRRKFLRR